jgi:hypothetical protein
MANTETFTRTLHDVGLAAWFGGTLMGAVGLNGASNEVSDPRERARVASAGWGRWVPWQAAAIGAHLIGGAHLLVNNRNRASIQAGTRSNTMIKTACTGAALAVTAYSRVLGRRIDQAGYVPTAGGTKPNEDTPSDVAGPQQQLRALQWAIPAITGVLLVLNAQQGEQQKPESIVAGTAKTLGKVLHVA